MCSSIFLNFGSFMSLNTSLIQLIFFLLTTVDNLVTYIENKNCKDFIMEDGERLI